MRDDTSDDDFESDYDDTPTITTFDSLAAMFARLNTDDDLQDDDWGDDSPPAVVAPAVPSPETETDPASLTMIAALKYVALGLRPIPLPARSKSAKIGRWPMLGMPDEETVGNWYTGNPDEEGSPWAGMVGPSGNVGIVGGNGIIILDIDPRNGGRESLEKLVEEFGPLPETATVRTGGHGTHLYFRLPPGVEVGKSEPSPGVEVKGQGAYVVAPPSVHPDTSELYEWERHPSDGIAEIPRAWLDMILSRESPTKPRSKRVVKLKPKASAARKSVSARHGQNQRPVLDNDALLADMIQRFPATGPGTRGNAMCQAVGSLVRRGAADEQAERVMMAWHDHFYRQGLCGSDPEVMNAELLGCLMRTRANPNFTAVLSEADFVTAYAAMEVPEPILSRLTFSISALIRMAEEERVGPDQDQSPEKKDTGEGQTIQPVIRVTKPVDFSNCLCMSSQESEFVEAVLCIWLFKRTQSNEAAFKFTHRQLCDLAALRFPDREKTWEDHTQIKRLKNKYIDRLIADGDGNGTRKSADRFELLQEVVKGQSLTRGGRGLSSEYVATGIERLFGHLFPPAATEPCHRDNGLTDSPTATEPCHPMSLSASPEPCYPSRPSASPEACHPSRPMSP